jgi:hypothetical protein
MESELCALLTAAVVVPRLEGAEGRQQLFQEATHIELAFLVDATHSMTNFLQAVADQCIAIADDTSRTHGRGCELRVAFVAYRDLNCIVNVESLDFTTSLGAFKTFVRGVGVEGGSDICEDVFGGLERLGQLSWSTEPGSAKCLPYGGRPLPWEDLPRFPRQSQL